MSKWDVGVGSEFPTEEIHRDENGVVHHHHYYRRRRYRGPFGFLRIILMVAMILLVIRAFRYANWLDLDWPELPWLPHGFVPFTGTLVMIAVVGGLLYFLRCQDERERP